MRTHDETAKPSIGPPQERVPAPVVGGRSGAPAGVLDLQKTLGNRATRRIIDAGQTSSTGTTVFRRGPRGLVPLTGVRVNHTRITVPQTGVRFRAAKVPGSAPGVTLSIVGDGATIAGGTTVDSTTGVITIAAGQTGGSAHVEASQNATGPGGVTLTSTSPATAPFNFTAIPGAISQTSVAPRGARGSYGGDFTHTFASPAGGQSALERAHVNELFPSARGTTLRLRGLLGSLTIAVNAPNAAGTGWDLDDAGTMTGADHVTWDHGIDARPFVANASHPSPAGGGLPQELTATQNFRNLTFPARTYAAAPVASTTHRRAIEERSNRLVAVTSAGVNAEVVEDYAGPTVFRNCVASPASIPVTPPRVRGGPAPTVVTSSVTVDAEGQRSRPGFSIRGPKLGCRISAGGTLTPGPTAGTVTVRAGSAASFDETTVTLTP